MIYVPKLYNLEAEYKALNNQNFSNDVYPLLFIVMAQKKSNSPISILDDFENLIHRKSKNTFFVSIPQNLPLATKTLKSTVNRFYSDQKTNPTAYLNLMKRFSAFENVIPTIEVENKIYSPGKLTEIKSSITSGTGSYAYYVKSSSLQSVEKEIKNIITNNDFLIYDLDAKDFSKTSVQKELLIIEDMKNLKKFKAIVLKQVYSELTFPKYPDGKILPGTDAYDCLDLDFYTDFKKHNFNGFGDCAGIRDIPIYDGGASYPSYLTIELDTFDHHGFKGIPMDVRSFEDVLLPKYLASDHWNKILTPSHKTNCNGCRTINDFSLNRAKINNAAKWKTITVSHFIESMDYKISKGII